MNDNQLVFTSDNITKSQARSDKNYFVNIIKNPILRFLLRIRVIKESDIEKKLQPTQPKPAPVMQTVVNSGIETKPRPRPQCRMNIRIARRITEKKKKNKSAKIAIVVLLILLALSIGAAVYFAIS